MRAACKVIHYSKSKFDLPQLVLKPNPFPRLVSLKIFMETGRSCKYYFPRELLKRLMTFVNYKRACPRVLFNFRVYFVGGKLFVTPSPYKILWAIGVNTAASALVYSRGNVPCVSIDRRD